MQKTKKLIALLLSLVLIFSTMALAFSVSAEELTTGVVESTEPEEEPHEEHRTFADLFVTMWEEIIAFFKYIFYDVFRGAPAPDIPEAPTKFAHE